MRVLICGDRNWKNRTLMRLKILEYTNASPETVIIHGSARGADTIAGEIAKEYGLRTQEFPAEWDKYGKAAGLIRNQKMLDEGKPDLVLAFHDNILKSKGTKDMIHRALKKGIKVLIFDNKYDSLEDMSLEERRKLTYKLQIANNLLDLISEKLR